jgi:hypothetical protein
VLHAARILALSQDGTPLLSDQSLRGQGSTERSPTSLGITRCLFDREGFPDMSRFALLFTEQEASFPYPTRNFATLGTLLLLSLSEAEWLGRFGSAQLSTSPWRSDHLIAPARGVWRMASEDSVEDVLQGTLSLLAVEVHRIRELNDAGESRGLPMSSEREQVQNEPEAIKVIFTCGNRMYRIKHGTTVAESTGREWIEYTSTDSFPGFG